MLVGMQSKKMFDLREIVKKFLMNLQKTRWKFVRAMDTIRQKKENLKDGESELQNNLKSKFN